VFVIKKNILISIPSLFDISIIFFQRVYLHTNSHYEYIGPSATFFDVRRILPVKMHTGTVL